MNGLNDYWRNHKWWPVEMPGFVFLAKAVNQLGRSRYPVSWAGDEAWIDVPPPLPEDQDKAERAQVRRAYALLDLPVAEIELPMVLPKGFGKATTIISRLSEDDWDAARLLSLEIAVPAAEKRARWDDVRELTATFFRVGGLHCHVRAVAGGPYEGPLKPEVWNTENTSARFGRCLIDLGNLYGQTTFEPHTNIRANSYGRQNFRLIFVDERSLANCLEAVPKLTPPPEWIADKTPEPVAVEGKRAPRTTAHREEFKEHVRQEVRDNMAAPPEGWNRARYINEVGRQRFRLPKPAAETAYKEALIEVEGNDWSRTGPKTKRKPA